MPASISSALLGTTATRGDGRWARYASHAPIVRADLKSAARIVDVMASDLLSHKAAAGGVDHAALKLIGWTAAQIAAHAEDAILLARRRAGDDA